MNEILNDLFKKMSSNEAKVRNDAFLNLSLIIEGTLIPARTRENDELLDRCNLKKLKLSESNAKALLRDFAVELNIDNFPFDIRVSIASFLGKFANKKYVEAIIEFLLENFTNLDDPQIHAVLGSINPCYLPRKEHSLVSGLF